MGVNFSLPETVTRQRRDCDLNPGPSVPESSTLTTRLITVLIIIRDYTALRSSHRRGAGGFGLRLVLRRMMNKLNSWCLTIINSVLTRT